MIVTMIDITDDIYRAAYDRLATSTTKSDRADAKATRADVKAIRADVKDLKVIVSKIRPSHDTEATDRELGPQANRTIPLKPKREDFEPIHHWTQEEHNGNRHSKGETTPNRGDSTEPVSYRFMEDENGKMVSPAVRREVSKDVRAFWQEKHNAGIHVGKLTSMGLDIRDDFRARMEKAYPWLRLCEGHWKVDQLWSMNFSKWKPATTPESDATNLGTLKREHPTDENQAGPSSKKTKITAVGKLASHKPKVINKVYSSFTICTRLLNTSHR